MPKLQRINPCLWFANEGEEAAKFYTSIFPNSRITSVVRYTTAGFDQHHQPAGSVATVAFELDGVRFTALNAGPVFKFNEAISMQINCKDQDEIDYYWNKLGAGGDPEAQVCGWLKDKYGLSWQVVPDNIDEYYQDDQSPATKQVWEVMMKMKKIDIETLKQAREGVTV